MDSCMDWSRNAWMNRWMNKSDTQSCSPAYSASLITVAPANRIVVQRVFKFRTINYEAESRNCYPRTAFKNAIYGFKSLPHSNITDDMEITYLHFCLQNVVIKK
jgi:hypothetical protein